MSNSLVPYGSGAMVPYEPPGEVSLLGNSLLAQTSPETILRLRGALFRDGALKVAGPIALAKASGIADRMRIEAQLSPQKPFKAGFNVSVGNNACGGFAVTIKGEVWCD